MEGTNERMNKTLKALERIAYRLSRMCEDCVVCGEPYFPTSKRNSRCVDCQLKDRYQGKGEPRK